MKHNTRYFTTFLFLIITVISIAVRLWKIDQPIADWHSFRQADTASVARIFTARGIDLLHPRYHDLSNIQSGKDNPQGWRMVEFPLYQGIAARVYTIIPFVSIEIYLRLITILCSTLTGLLLGIMVIRRTTVFTGLMTFLAYAILPYGIFYGRAVLPDPFMVFLSILSVFLLDTKGQDISWMTTVISGVIAALALLVKPQAAFLLLPVLALFSIRPITGNKILKFLLWGSISVIPFILWRIWIQQYPEGIPVFDWLLNQNGIRFKGAWFFWLFADRIGRLILGYWGLILFGLGLVVVNKKEGMFFLLILIGSLLYLVVIAGGNVQHDYYQILLLPVISIYTSIGFAYLWNQKEKERSRIGSRCLAIISVLFLLSFSWYTVRTYYWINRPEIIEAGVAADKLLPVDAKVIAAYNGDTTFLYQTKRTGWPLNFDIDKKISMGATHYITVSPTDADLETKELAQKYTVLVRNDKYAIIDLTRKK
ncbi:MAG: hypothetical protein UV63_C0003G0003 [Microgenomates group bacterium GW2011_GWC1_43_11]|uniref:Glycosyltransferase RgtA/B/C/D-like domain-containing protein n=2 Tax=Candidatus Gottesmaniibacteriota TaxID=1752720 RepID=A0A0G1IPT1_9BACT|nr:MAG: hypothetical protein UV63_C0003G0003 [Microgenomates group bacterium GW2011_GWC1_43_11]KKT38966.1 MAG: hypothetical protein UW22_C0003G0008 [Candidatus Gottesmanbacteria bacterium GW2011_GWB1_44_11c]KKT61391.1 MAG: hypothetical protein UW52_C0004G0003 [Candidatus Gottesmanbacteria bacterium GW2011_GWA1_44_24b]HCM81774.1 hypothetical protein [Patescibacteria group bacterium]